MPGGLTQAEVGERVGLAFSYISRLEHERVALTLSCLELLAKGLGVGVHQFVLDATSNQAALKPFPQGLRSGPFCMSFGCCLAKTDLCFLDWPGNYLAQHAQNRDSIIPNTLTQSGELIIV